MKSHLTGIFKSNWFFVALLCFVIVLPLSQALVSVFSGVLLFVAIIEDSWTNRRMRLKKRKVILLVPLIFLLYLISTLFTLKSDKSFYDVQKTMFYFVFPVAFALGKEISSYQKRIVFYTFTVSILLASFITIYNWKFSPNNLHLGIHKASLVSHIRFSFQLILTVWFWIFFLKQNKNKNSKKVLLIAIPVYFVLFLFLQQSLTGILAFGGSLLFFFVYAIYSIEKKYKIPLILIGTLIFVIPIGYVATVINQFYSIEQVNSETVEKTTKLGNLYKHDFNKKTVENGQYVYLYVCAEEMKEEWNKVSEFKYDSIGTNGYPIHSTLVRYLTSKGVRKDAEGLRSLTKQDILNVENGLANVIYQRKYSIYPRIYQTVWEYYTYSNTGYVNHQSFSQRIEFSKAALVILEDNFWFGVGTGNWRTEFAEAFKSMNSRLDKTLYASSHNQYLNYMVKFGFIGFLLIMFILVFPVIKSKRYHDNLFLVFLIFMFFANFADSNLESHMGSSFFLFFYCFFITTNGINYLKNDKS